MEEKNNIEEEKSKEYIKILNKEKVLEFKLNQKSGFDESEIIVKNICEKNIISKIYINNQKYFKFIPNIFLLPKNSDKKIKVVMDNKDYIISNKDIFPSVSVIYLCNLLISPDQYSPTVNNSFPVLFLISSIHLL